MRQVPTRDRHGTSPSKPDSVRRPCGAPGPPDRASRVRPWHEPAWDLPSARASRVRVPGTPSPVRPRLAFLFLHPPPRCARVSRFSFCTPLPSTTTRRAPVSLCKSSALAQPASRRYSGVPTAYGTLARDRHDANRTWLRALERRGQRDDGRGQHVARDTRFPLPKPAITHPWTETRFAARKGGPSRAARRRIGTPPQSSCLPLLLFLLSAPAPRDHPPRRLRIRLEAEGAWSQVGEGRASARAT